MDQYITLYFYFSDNASSWCLAFSLTVHKCISTRVQKIWCICNYMYLNKTGQMRKRYIRQPNVIVLNHDNTETVALPTALSRHIKSDVFICLGRQTKQIMVAKFQSLMLLIANAESSPLFWSGYFPDRTKLLTN
jgi:hypothetical protein